MRSPSSSPDRIDKRTREIIDTAAPQDPAVAEALEVMRDELSAALPGDLRSAGLKDLTEFGRAVHAEMNALLDADRRGVAVQGATLYTTTFPCHNCARHIVGAGIDRVVFIEPYTKSRAEQLHADSIAIARAEHIEGKVNFVPFVGVAPRRYGEMFDAAARQQLGHLPRKDDAGRKQNFDKKQASPVFSDGGLAQFRARPSGNIGRRSCSLSSISIATTTVVRPNRPRRFQRHRRTPKGSPMADAEARRAAIKKASQQVRAGGVFSRASACQQGQRRQEV